MNQFRGGGGKGRQKRNQRAKKRSGGKTGPHPHPHNQRNNTTTKTAGTSRSSVDPALAKVQELVGAAFHNHVIVEQILTYLDYSSIKALSCVSQRFKSIIRANKNFLDRTRVTFLKANGCVIGPPGPKPTSFNPADFPWKTVGVHVNGGWKKKEFTGLIRLLSNINSLELHGMQFFFTGQQDKNYLQTLPNILRACVALKELTIDSDVINQITLSDMDSAVLGDSDIRTNLKQIESLQFTSSILSNERYHDVASTEFGSNIEKLGEIPTTLTRFSFERIMSYHGLEFDDGPGSECASSITNALSSILERHKASLQSLRLDGVIWESPSILPMIFSNLTELSLVTYGEVVKNVAVFLKYQPPLTRLSVKFLGVCSTSVEFEDALLRHGPQLKQFNLTWRFHSMLLLPNQPDARVPVPDDDWDAPEEADEQEDEIIQFEAAAALPEIPVFQLPIPGLKKFSFDCLASFKRLEEVQIHQCSPPNDHFVVFMPLVIGERDTDSRSSLASILSQLPDGIRKIDVAGTSVPNQTSDSLQNIMESLSRFRNLAVLNLLHCSCAIDDEVLGFICTSMTQLVELGFSHCHQLTDVGLVGRRSGTVIIQHGLKALTSLRKLQICFCSQLTRKGYLASIALPALRVLTLLTTQGQLNNTFYVDLVRHNKMLEVIEISNNEVYSLEKLERILKRQFHRFCAVKFVDPITEALQPSGDEYEFFGSDFTSDMDNYYGSDFDYGFGETDDEEDDLDWGF